MSLRRDRPELWSRMVMTVRETVGDWSEDQIAAVISKVRADTPEDLIPALGHVLAWCAAAQSSGDEEAMATVELWQMPELPIVIFADADGVRHALDVGDMDYNDGQPDEAQEWHDYDPDC